MQNNGSYMSIKHHKYGTYSGISSLEQDIHIVLSLNKALKSEYLC